MFVELFNPFILCCFLFQHVCGELHVIIERIIDEVSKMSACTLAKVIRIADLTEVRNYLLDKEDTAGMFDNTLHLLEEVIHEIMDCHILAMIWVVNKAVQHI